MRVRWTGKRVGWDEAHIPGFGDVRVGDVIEVDDAAGAEMIAVTEGKSDWELVKDAPAKAKTAEEVTDGR
jgi:hypothetical protein